VSYVILKIFYLFFINNVLKAFLANADGKYHEVRAMLLSGQDLLARCRSNDCHTITDTLQRLQVLSEDVQEKAGRYKVWYHSVYRDT
jgi:hypothetical protein